MVQGPEGSAVAVVHPEPDDLIAGARSAAEMARAGVEGEVAGVLVFSCVTRSILLEERASEELDAIREAFASGTPLVGFYTYSEVARVEGKLDGFHNHSVVVAAIPA